MKSLLIAILLLPLPACQNESKYTPDEEENRILNTYVSLSMLNSSFPSTASSDSIGIYNTKADSILKHYGFSREEFQGGMKTLITSSDRFRQLFEEIHTRLQNQTPEKGK